MKRNKHKGQRNPTTAVPTISPLTPKPLKDVQIPSPQQFSANDAAQAFEGLDVVAKDRILRRRHNSAPCSDVGQSVRNYEFFFPEAMAYAGDTTYFSLYYNNRNGRNPRHLPPIYKSVWPGYVQPGQGPLDAAVPERAPNSSLGVQQQEEKASLATEDERKANSSFQHVATPTLTTPTMPSPIDDLVGDVPSSPLKMTSPQKRSSPKQPSARFKVLEIAHAENLKLCCEDLRKEIANLRADIEQEKHRERGIIEGEQRRRVEAQSIAVEFDEFRQRNENLRSVASLCREALIGGSFASERRARRRALEERRTELDTQLMEMREPSRGQRLEQQRLRERIGVENANHNAEDHKEKYLRNCNAAIQMELDRQKSNLAVCARRWALDLKVLKEKEAAFLKRIAALEAHLALEKDVATNDFLEVAPIETEALIAQECESQALRAVNEISDLKEIHCDTIQHLLKHTSHSEEEDRATLEKSQRNQWRSIQMQFHLYLGH